MPSSSAAHAVQIIENAARRRARQNELAAQQIAAASDDDSLLHIATVSAMVGLARSTIYERIAGGHFPAPVRLSAKCSRWKAGSVRGWLKAQGQAQPA